eukprot:5668766-Alexandrium_andersonii.AAC.1
MYAVELCFEVGSLDGPELIENNTHPITTIQHRRQTPSVQSTELANTSKTGNFGEFWLPGAVDWPIPRHVSR